MAKYRIKQIIRGNTTREYKAQLQIFFLWITVKSFFSVEGAIDYIDKQKVVSTAIINRGAL